MGRCGRMLVGASAAILVGEGGARFTGTETCGSVWLCPVCSSKIAEHRRGEIEALLNAHIDGDRRRWGGMEWEGYKAQPGAVYMLTLTVPHKAWDSLKVMREAVAECWTKVVRGAPWDRWKLKAGVVGAIRAMEVTHGKNGWHPHLHVLLLTKDLDDDLEAEFRIWLAERWAKMVVKAGLGDINAHGVDFYRASQVSTAGGYVAKWGCDSELTKWHVKGAKGANRSPWQLLAAAGEGDKEARMRWREFSVVFAGTRHITMSHGLRDLYLDGAELSDDEICAMDHGIDPAELVKVTGETIVGHLRRGMWVRCVRKGLLPEILDHAEAGGWPAIIELLNRHNLSGGLNAGRRGG